MNVGNFVCLYYVRFVVFFFFKIWLKWWCMNVLNIFDSLGSVKVFFKIIFYIVVKEDG